MLRSKFRTLKGVERCTSGEEERTFMQAAGSVVRPVLGNRVGGAISLSFIKLVNDSSPCRPPMTNCRISTPFARNPNGPPHRQTRSNCHWHLCLRLRCGDDFGRREMQSPRHPRDAAKLPSDELWPCESSGFAFAKISAVGTASISPRPIYGGPARSPTDRRKPLG